jgi:hypothetical protein
MEFRTMNVKSMFVAAVAGLALTGSSLALAADMKSMATDAVKDQAVEAAKGQATEAVKGQAGSMVPTTGAAEPKKETMDAAAPKGTEDAAGEKAKETAGATTGSVESAAGATTGAAALKHAPGGATGDVTEMAKDKATGMAKDKATKSIIK